MFGIATVKETLWFYQKNFPLSAVPLPYSTRQWEYPWCYSRLMDFNVGKNSRVLDVGCACNPFMIRLSEDKIKVVGLDLYSITDLRNPHSQFAGFDPALENKYLSFCEAGMSDIPFPHDYFDAVYCLSVLEHCEESIRLAGIQEMLRVLKPGKPLIITEDFIPNAIQRPSPGVIEVCKRVMDYDFRQHIASVGRPLADPNVKIPSDKEIAYMRDRGELLLNCVVTPTEYYHFTAVGWVVCK